MCLRGSAQKVLSELTLLQINDYLAIKNDLMRRFSPSGREFAYKCEFKNKHRKEDESLTDYGEKLRTLAAIAFPYTSVS